MVFRILDRVKMSVTGAPGAGTVTLNAALSSYQTVLQAGLQDGDTFAYSMVDGSNWEFGVGTYTQLTNSFTRSVTKTSAQNTTPLSLSSATIMTAVLRGEDVFAASTLAGLTDVNVTEGAGIDGYTLNWHNATGQWQAVAPVTGGGGGGGSSTLAGDTDVSISSPSNGQVLTYNSGTSKWGNAAIPSIALSGLSDVSVTEGAGINGYTLNWNNAAGKWEAVAPVTGGGSSTLASDTDVSISSPSNGQVLTYNSSTSKWNNAAIPSIALSALSDVSVTEGSGINGYTLNWNNSAGKWQAVAPVSGGGGTLTVSNNGTVVDSAATTNNIINATSITTSSHDVTVTLPAGSGGAPGGTAPTVVQFGDVSANSTAPSVTLGAAPTNGNLLVAFVYSDSAVPAAASGWTAQANAGTGTWYNYIFTKTAGASESATQSPVTGSSGHWAIGMWEVNGQNGTTPLLAVAAVNGTANTALPGVPAVFAPAASLFLGALISTTVAQALGTPFGVQHVDGNLSAGAGGKPVFGHSDSSAQFYGISATMTTATGFDQTYAIVQH